MDSNQQWEESTYLPVVGVDRLRFHHRCGSMVKLSASQRTSERRRPLDEFNNGVVMTQRPLLPDELFEIRIESLVDKWSGSIEVGHHHSQSGHAGFSFNDDKPQKWHSTKISNFSSFSFY